MFLGLCVFRTVRFRLTLGESALEMLVYITLYLTLPCHHQNNSCIKMGSDESHFNVSLIAIRTKSQDSVHRPQPSKREESRSGIEPWSFCLPALRLTARPNRLTC